MTNELHIDMIETLTKSVEYWRERAERAEASRAALATNAADWQARTKFLEAALARVRALANRYGRIEYTNYIANEIRAAIEGDIR